jgi:hypothetical protein
MTLSGIDEGSLTNSFERIAALDFSTTMGDVPACETLADMGA